MRPKVSPPPELWLDGLEWSGEAGERRCHPHLCQGAYWVLIFVCLHRRQRGMVWVLCASSEHSLVDAFSCALCVTWPCGRGLASCARLSSRPRRLRHDVGFK